jgi:UDPglucose 6-dehydrogenase
MKTFQISIVGTGYVGLSTAVGFASKGYGVIASTHDQEKAALINKAIPPFFESGLQEALENAVKNGYLTCLLDREEAIMKTNATFISVGTPSQPDGSIDLQFIKQSAKEIGRALNKKKSYHLVVVKSTVIPGTTEKVVKPEIEKHSKRRCGVDFGLCMNPEFLRQGNALHDTLHPDRVIIGEYDKKSGDVLEELYRNFYGEKKPPMIRTSLVNAELIKYVNNAFLAAKISFINSIANICERTPDADVLIIKEGIGLDKRIGPLFLNAGLGYGGSCFPKDVKALIAYSNALGYDSSFLNTVENVNKIQPYRAVELAKGLLHDLKGKRIAVLGLAFKPNTDDMREAVSVKIINWLLQEGAYVTAYDPVATSNTKKIFGNRVEYVSSAIECLKGADCCILVTEWDEFRKLVPEDFVENMRQPCLVDGRRIYDPEKYSRKLEFRAVGLGLP